MVGRHGERYPTASKAKSIMATWYKLGNYTGQFNGSLSFLNDDYEFFIRDTNNLEMETTLANSVDFLLFFTSSSQRCHDTAQFFIDGLGDQFNISLQTISEAESAGANTLSAHHSCAAWDDDVNDDILKKYDTKYLSGIAKRLNKENKGLNLTSSDATKLLRVRFSYSQDLETYYQTGPGYDVVRSVGANLFNASVKLLKESEVQDQKVWLSFTHDTDILNYLTTIGIIDDKNNLTAEYVPFMGNTFHRSWYVPQGARVYTEKFQCSNDTYVRYGHQRCCRSNWKPAPLVQGSPVK
ncbi:BAH_G0025070.mRNA.1.CDS.1 [Saccharomyces cerevisiae]|nr:BAH_G0025070.mRNA.1.CDS.1 [Saccharomyces cerevisiae]CAI7170542.1 BAH_G0025070.mRNA.1.CDS.1 [Saccharomyces cerevisiae]